MVGGEPYLTLDVEGSYFIYPDNCPAGSQCWGSEGHCTVLCKEGQFGEGECPLPDHFCGVLRDSVYCIENCDPLVQDCPEGDTCTFADYQIAGCFLDYSADKGKVFDPCYDPQLCDPGLACIGTLSAKECNPNDEGCCLPFCDLDKPAVCPGGGQVCVAFFEPGDVPPGYENLGVCSVPF